MAADDEELTPEDIGEAGLESRKPLLQLSFTTA